ncbi:CDP-diacylglycerol--glycerol-3-phosphate 3-phosphatidyltransferase [Thermodesulfobacteriota bacterium]
MFRDERTKKILTHPNALTLYRIAAVPIIVVLMYFPNRFCTFLAALFFSAAAITDYLDGYFARQRGQVSSLGKILDPIADKLIVSASFVMLASLNWIPAWVVCVIIGREFAVTGLRNIIAEQRMDVSASNLGKYKTGFQIAAIIPLLMHYSYFGVDLDAIGQFFLWCALVMTVWSGADYFVRFRRLLQV